MKTSLIAILSTLLLASPAYATGGLVCRTAGANLLQVSLVVSHTAVSSVVSARLSEKGRDMPVALAQSWLDASEVRVDLTDRNAMRHELRLTARRSGDVYDGSIWRSGKRRWVRCREG